MEVAWRNPLIGYGAQSSAQLDAILERYVHQIPNDTTSLRLQATYQHLAYQFSYCNPFYQKHRGYDND